MPEIPEDSDLADLFSAYEAPSKGDETSKSDECIELTKAENPEATGTARFLFFDFETIPHPSIDIVNDHWRFRTELPEVVEESPDDAMMSSEEFVSQTLEAMKESLAARNPSVEWINATIKCEQSTKKPRKGAIEALEAAIKAKTAYQDAIAAREKEASCSPEMCMIVSMAWGTGGKVESMLLQPDNEDDSHIVHRFWELAEKCRKVVGYNCIGFDLPVVMTRSMLLKIAPSRQISLSPFSNPHCIDLMLARFGRGGQARGQKWLGKSLGCEATSEEDGSKVLDLYRQGKLEEIAAYNESDVIQLQQLHELMKGFFV